jgi:bifunctional UDP-N-acetylglucosamine pyrophosphorylase/glucosamine-1-phosphate N-acetyltransferase
MNEKTSVVILAAGLGTRMRSRIAKVLHRAGGLALVEHVVRSALHIADAQNIVVVTGHQAEQVEALLAPYGVLYARQTEQLGTGHALSICAPILSSRSGRLVVLYGDCPLLASSTLRRLIEAHAAEEAAATVITTDLEDPSGYGRAILDDNDDVRAIVEQKVATPEQQAVRTINSGIYCFEAGPLWKHLPSIRPNPVSHEYYLTDIVEILNGAGERVAALRHADSAELLGINNRVELADVDNILRVRKVRELMLSGVTVLKPETVTADLEVSVGTDTIIEPFAQLLGSTTIGDNCRIGAGAVIRDSRIDDDVEIAPYTFVVTSKVESGASVGPFARLRMENHVEAGAHIGNFVELKKTRFRAGAQAGHLAYLGDSDIGAKVNIGAGTITCNFDGVKKHRTLIGDNAFVGSNSTLVAPAQIGEGSYIAAGSVITEAVPPGALAIGRGRQLNKEGWTAKRKEKLRAPVPVAAADAQ